MTRTRAFVTAAVFFLLSVSSGLLAAEWHVAPPPLGNDSNPGTNELPFATIQRGIDAASSGDTVTVGEGTYQENVQFKGKDIVLTGTDPLNPDVIAKTIIQGRQLGPTVTFSGTEKPSCSLSGFTVWDGKAENGGAILGNGTHATIGLNVITGGTADKYGGGIHGCDGLIALNVITINSAGSPGGGLAFCDGPIQFNMISFCWSYGSLGGGGLYECNGTIQNNTITANSAKAQWGTGGGLAYCDGTIQNNVISGNSALDGGGGLACCDGTIQNNVISGNSASDGGGGLHDCDGTIQNNTITGNSTTWPYSSGGLYSCGGTIRNCIIWGNTAPSDPQLYASNTPIFSCIEGWSGEWQGNIGSDPRFVNPNGSDYHLQAGSPCMNAGANHYSFAWPQRDRDGNCRLVGLAVDMGCYEYGSSPDADGDLLSDSDESAAGTNALDEDSDHDGLRDGLEFLRGSDPLQLTPPGILNVPSEFATIQKSLCVSIPGDEIIVAPGTYLENLQFCGPDVILRSSDPGDPNIVGSTIIDGAGAGPVVRFMGGESEACVLDGFTIRNGEALEGGGICGGTELNRTHATIQHNTITANSAGWGGGLSWCDGTIQNNTITDNSAWYGGGLAYCDGTIQNNTIASNGASAGADCYGGGLAYCGGTIENNTIAGNSAYGGGGLAFCDGTIQNNEIAGNSAKYGGGVYDCKGPIQNNTVTGNSAGAKGGGLYECNGTIQNNVITGNSAAQWGGGLGECDDGTIQNNTIAGNFGGGLGNCNATILNCIIWGNTHQLYESSIPTYSCIEGWTGAATKGNISEDPQFVDPAGPDNAPSTYEDNDYRLSAASPCIDAGFNDPELPEFDIAGMHRIMFGGKSLTVDMGAYEFYINTLSGAPFGNARLTWSSLAEETYRVEYSRDMLTWETADESVPSAGNTTTNWIDTTAPFVSRVRIRYYRTVEK